MTALEFAHYCVMAGFGGLLAWAAIEDFRSFVIRNWVVLALLALYPIHVLTAPQTVAWTSALLIGAIVFGVGALFFFGGFMGGGDVKLLAATALWVGPQHSVAFLFVTVLCGFLLAAVMAIRGALASAPAGAEAPALSIRSWIGAFAGLRYAPLMKLTVPYGVAVALGGIYVGARFLLVAAE